ncbi:hypothetical protein SAMN05421538_11726 [Paracoccus isoporae]|uniref:Uncharacterized protein n=1 Tax=Paracoccus isoporae TaxID=591205 RepID=A0A1G7H5N1_9RHOB|nr:hypothetical protein SAMN05421538_11726 [Paracoccus isoporae]
MPRDQFAIVGRHAGHGLAELRHAGSNLRHLVIAVHPGIARLKHFDFNLIHIRQR